MQKKENSKVVGFQVTVFIFLFSKFFFSIRKKREKQNLENGLGLIITCTTLTPAPQGPSRGPRQPRRG